MSFLITILRHTVRGTARTKPIFHASVTRRPFPTRQAYLVSLLVAFGVTIARVVPRDTQPSTATSIPMLLADLSSLTITRVVSAPVIPRDALNAAAWPVEVLVAIHFQFKCHSDTPS